VSKRNFFFNYDDNLISEMFKSIILGAIASNIIAPIVVIYILFGLIPLFTLTIWFCIHILLFILKIYSYKQFTASKKSNNGKTRKFLIFYAINAFITAFLLGSIVMVGVIYKVPDIDILMISIFAVTVSAGSIGSIGTVFIVFLGFTFFSITPVVVALWYHGGDNFDTFAMVLSIYIFIHMISGLKFFNTNRRNIELQKKFKTIYNKSFDGIALIRGHKIIECNDRLAKMFGYKNEREFLSYNTLKFMPPTQNSGESSIKKMLKKLKKASKQTISFEWIQTKKNGNSFWVEITLIPVEIDKEKMIYGVWRDIDERKKTEKKLKEDAKQIKALQEKTKIALLGTNSGTWEWNLINDVIASSVESKMIVGYTEQEYGELFWQDIVHPDDLKLIMLILQNTLNLKEKNIEATYRVKHKNGKWVWLMSRGVIEYDENQKPVNIVGVNTDITAIKKAEDEIKRINSNLEKEIVKQLNILRQKDQQLLHQSRLAQMGEMISMIAHQWRQPLTAISATSGAINLKAQLNRLDKDMAIELSSKISNYSQHLSSTIDDFRDFFKSNKEKKETNYNEIVQNVLGIIETSITNKNIEIIKELNTDDTFNSYPNELKQVIMNLIKNAEDVLLEKKIKNPTIHIKTYKQDDKLILEISDNAGGVPKDILPKIFDPYFSTKTKKDGTGLGLYMSKTIIEEHCNGTLSVSNSDVGAVFRVEVKE